MKRYNARALLNNRERVIKRVRALNPTLATDLNELQLDWYRIKNQDSDEADVFIYEEIGGFWGMPADEFVKELNDIDAGTINVRINSPGGSVFDSVAIYNALVKHPATVRVFVDSLAASGASIIAMAADPYSAKKDTGGVVMMVGSQMMIHDALGIEIGNAAQFREFAEFLDGQSDNIATIYAERAGGTAKEWRDRMIAETWVFAEEAIDLGLADAIYTRPVEEDDEDEDEDEDETEEDEDDEDDEDEDDEDEDDEDDKIEDLMSYRHSLTNRGYRYTGRRRAPNPRNFGPENNKASFVPTDTELDNFCSALSNTLKP